MAGGILGGLGVALGAFGTHWLQDAVQRWGLEPEEQTKRLEIWEVAVRYQMYHALALLALGVLATRANDRCLGWSAKLLLVGVIIFSGCLYALVLSGIKMLGAIVPVGGTCLMVGWMLLAGAVRDDLST